MRGDLQKLPKVADITTDFKTNIATFKIPKDTKKAELTAKLEEYAKKNKHMKDWSYLDDGQGGTDKKDKAEKTS